VPIPIAVETVAVLLCKLIESHVPRFATRLHLVELVASGIKLTASISGKYWYRKRDAAKHYGSGECQLPKHHDLHLNTIESIDPSP
jgi:hypothetical protein